MKKVIIYTADYCPFCTKAKRLFDIKKISYKEIDVTENKSLREEMEEKSGGKRTVPQIFIDGKSIGGCDDLYALHETEELDALLK
ncbi:glutaredoxin 3 [Alphaproteobacteria bacterium]|nr:glutaredoxin 3 [Alphaproteobacteria bacterium]